MWVARDKDGCLWLYIYKPIRSKTNYWWEVDEQNTPLDEDDCLMIDIELFPDLRWEAPNFTHWFLGRMGWGTSLGLHADPAQLQGDVVTSSPPTSTVPPLLM